MATALQDVGYDVLNRVVLNQILVRADTDVHTLAIIEAAQQSGKIWFGPTVWQGRPAFRISISSWRTKDRHIDQLVQILTELYR